MTKKHRPQVGRSFADLRREKESKSFMNAPEDPKKAAMRLLLAFREALYRADKKAAYAIERELAEMDLIIEADYETNELTLRRDPEAVDKVARKAETPHTSNRSSIMERAMADFERTHRVDPADMMRMVAEAERLSIEQIKSIFVESTPSTESLHAARRRLLEFQHRRDYEHNQFPEPWVAGPKPFEAAPAKEEPIDPPKLTTPDERQSLEFLANDFLDAIEGE